MISISNIYDNIDLCVINFILHQKASFGKQELPGEIDSTERETRLTVFFSRSKGRKFSGAELGESESTPNAKGGIGRASHRRHGNHRSGQG